MALFGKIRDINLFHTINDELLKGIIQTEVAYYKFALEQNLFHNLRNYDQREYLFPEALNSILCVFGVYLVCICCVFGDVFAVFGEFWCRFGQQKQI